jgi:uncharacterized membrane protein
VLFGLAAALLIGMSDFLGARSSERTTALQTTTAAFAGGALAVLLFSPLLGSPTGHDLLLGALSGVSLSVALTLLWKGYAQSSIGVAGPVAAVVSTVIPVLWDAVGGEVPGVFGWLGVVVGLAALLLTSIQPGSSPERGAVLGLVSGVFFSAMYLTAVSTSEDSGTWPVVTQRLTAFALAAATGLARRQRVVADRRSTGWSALAGMFGASGVAAVVYAGQRHPLAPVVVSSSMYIPVAVCLAWIFMHQHLSRRQVLGLIGAVLGVVLIALD